MKTLLNPFPQSVKISIEWPLITYKHEPKLWMTGTKIKIFLLYVSFSLSFPTFLSLSRLISLSLSLSLCSYLFLSLSVPISFSLSLCSYLFLSLYLSVPPSLSLERNPTFSKSVSFQVWHLLLLGYVSMSHEKNTAWYKVGMTFFSKEFVHNLNQNKTLFFQFFIRAMAI